MEGVQQSKKEVLLTDGATELDFFHVKYTEGSGGRKFQHLHVDKEKFKKSKRAILKINNPRDSLCLPRAIIEEEELQEKLNDTSRRCTHIL
jgi:hypothetical protein